MTAIDTDVAAAIAHNVAAQVGELRYNLWFKDNAKLDITDHELVVGVPNLFFQEWLTSNFLAPLRRAVETVTGRRLPVRLVVDGEMFRAMRDREQAAKLPVAAREPTEPTLVRSKPARGQTLDNFVVGSSNRLAHSAAMSLIESPSAQFNPLVFYGAVGLGKTHLLRGIAHAMREKHRGFQAVYLSAEAFTNAFLEDLRGNRLASFRQKMRGADMLLIDDVQFVATKRATKAELLHTYEAFDAEGKQLVVACDLHPRQIKEFGSELLDRLGAGMACPLQAPDFDTRVAILEAKAQAVGMRLQREVLEFVATHLRANVRELEGAINSLRGHAELVKGPLDVAAARAALADLLQHTQKTVSLKEVEQAVCLTFDVKVDQLRSPDRSRLVSQPRMLAMYLCRKHTGAPYDAIGHHFGGRNHSTVMFAERKVQRWIDEACAIQFAGRPWHVADAIRAIEQKLV